MEITILMPCLNEERTIGYCIEMAQQAIEKDYLNAEILIADNGSTDRSLTIAERMGARVINVSQKGYGSALRNGIEQAKGKFVIMGDSDCSYDFRYILPFINRLREGDDLVMGNRFKGGISKNAMPMLHKYLGNPVLSCIGRVFFRIPIGDFHCGLRGVNRDAMLGLNLTSNGMEFASEMIVKSSFKKLKLSEVPVKLYRDGRARPPHLRTWSDGWRHLKFLLIHSPKWLFLIPGLTMMVVGTSISFALFFNPLKVGVLNFDIGSMLYFSTSIILGFQLVSFYYFSKLFNGRLGIPQNPKKGSIAAQAPSLETGLVVGSLFLIAGLSLAAYCVDQWGNHQFGDLDPQGIMRLVIPSATMLILGAQIMFNSFFRTYLQSTVDKEIS